MNHFGCGFVVVSIAVLLGSVEASAQQNVVVAVPARAGAVEGTTENSDAFIWRVFTELTAPVSKGVPSPVVFETWASDADTFSPNPRWPTPGEPIKLHASVLAVAKTLGANQPLTASLAHTIDVPCQPPPGAAVGGFPTSGTPVPCVAEQVARNRDQFDYIIGHNLNTQAGLAAAYARAPSVADATTFPW